MMCGERSTSCHTRSVSSKDNLLEFLFHFRNKEIILPPRGGARLKSALYLISTTPFSIHSESRRRSVIVESGFHSGSEAYSSTFVIGARSRVGVCVPSVGSRDSRVARVAMVSAFLRT